MKLDTFKLGLDVTLDSIKKNSPEILIGLGVLSVIGGAILFCTETLKVKEVIEDHNDTLSEIKEYTGKTNSNGDTYTKEDADEDTVKLYAQTGFKVVKHYILPVGMTMMGIACILYSHKIMKSRNLALLASYNALDLAYKGYRQRVKEAVGDEREYDIFHGIKRELVEEEYIDEKGKKKKRMVEQVVDSGASNDHNSYFWGLGNANYNVDPGRSRFFVEEVEEQLNKYLNMKPKMAVVTKYDALKMLGLLEFDKFPSEQYTMGWINDGNTEIRLTTDPRFGKKGVSETWIDLNCAPILPRLKDYEKTLKIAAA